MSARYMQPLRILVQTGFFGFMIWLGYLFFLFVETVGNGARVPSVQRPDGIDGFLPISGFLGTVFWAKTGEINAIHPAAVVIFVTVILISFLLRRSFCSWICPVAAISEWAWKGGLRIFRSAFRLPLWLDIAVRSFKYLLLACFVYFIAIAMAPEALRGFIHSDYHKIADIRLMNFFLHISPSALAVLLVLFAVSILLRSPFCRYLCPYGALLGLVATLSPLRVTRDSRRCVSCGVCSQVCPTSIDVMHKDSVASPECIGCWRCISHCRFNEALSMRIIHRFALSGILFAVLVVLLFVGGSIIGKLNNHWHSSISPQEYIRILGY